MIQNLIHARTQVSPVLSIVGNRYDDQALAAQQHSTPYSVEPQRQQQHQQQQSAATPQQSPLSVSVITEHRYFEPLKGRSPSPHQEQQHQQAIAAAVQHNHHNRASKIPMLQGSLLEQQRIIIERPHLRTSRGPLASSGSYSATNASTDAALAAMRTNRASTMSIGNSAMDSHRYSHYVPPPQQSPSADDTTIAAGSNAQPPPDELRGQLPWSYFKSPSDITGPKRTFTHLRDDEDLPPVPVPDYTLHFPRKDRPSTNSSDEGGELFLNTVL